MIADSKRRGLRGDRLRQVLAGGLIGLPLAAAQAADQPVTFNKEIAPIIYQNCATCHRPGEAAPFSLLSYEDVRRKAKTISKVTSLHTMPPWKAEPASYPYRDERRLTEELDVEIHWDNSADNPHNPSSPPVAVSWGEGSKDEMGSISLIAVPHEQSELATLRSDLRKRDRQLARERMLSDPALAAKVARILTE